MGIATVLMAAGTGISAVASYQQGQAYEAQYKAQAKLNEYNARLHEQTAKAIEMKTKFDQIRQQKYARGVMGSLRAKVGASGAISTEGAPLSLMAEQASELALENALIGYEGMVAAGQARSQAGAERFQAGYNKIRAKNYATAGTLGAGSTLLSGFGQMASEGMFE